jgi:predicted permease
MIWNRLRYLSAARRRAEELEMQEEFESLKAMAAPGELGNLTLAAEEARAAWGWTWLEGIAADVRYAARTLRRQPGFVAVAALSLAFGIGAGGAIFSFGDALLFRPLPVPHPSQVLSVTNAAPDNPLEGMSYPDYRDLRGRSHAFAGLVAHRLITLGAAARPNAPAQIRLAALAGDNYFSALEIPMAIGRSFLPDEGRPPGAPVAILSHAFWEDQYGSDPAVPGRTLRLNGIEFTIIGVAPGWFTGTDRFVQPSLYVPLPMWRRLANEPADPLEDRARRELIVNGRLAPGFTRDAARAELATIGRDLERQYPATNHNRRAAVRTELELRIRQTPQQLSLVTMLMGLVALVLVIACSNVATLLLARSRARSREIAIRLAIGANRRRLVRQLMTESLMLALLGAAAGVALAWGGVLYLGTIEVPNDIPLVLGVVLDRRVVIFSLLLALASCLFFGLAPALYTVRTELVPALKAGGEAIAARKRMLGRNGLVAAQIALAMVLLLATGVFLHGFRKMLVTNPGFRTDHLISLEANPFIVRYSPAATYDFFRKLVDRARAIPGVQSVALAEALPLSPNQSFLAVVPEGYRFPKGRERAPVFGGAVSESYFDTMNVAILRGRAFTAADRTGTRRVAIVNEQFAKTYWPGQDPIGKRVRMDGPESSMAEVVGVARTTCYLIVNEPPAPYLYLPYEQNRRSRMTLVAQSYGDPAALAAPLREVIRVLDANLPIFNLRTYSTLYEARATGTFLMFLQMVGTMGLMGVSLALVGLYGLIAYSVSRRTAEFGLRMAIGASRADVTRMVLKQGLRLAAAGIAAGAVLTAFTAPLLRNAVAGLGGSGTALFVVVPLALVIVSMAASYLPARTAARLDPIRALRHD